MCKQSTQFRQILDGYISRERRGEKQFWVMGFSGGFYQVIGPETISPACSWYIPNRKNQFAAHKLHKKSELKLALLLVSAICTSVGFSLKLKVFYYYFFNLIIKCNPCFEQCAKNPVYFNMFFAQPTRRSCIPFH
jgi:hypothetical protein